MALHRKPTLTRNIIQCLLLWSMVCACNISLASSNDKQKSKQTIQLVTGSNYFPFISDQVPEGGWSQALVKAVFRQMDENIHIDVLPWARGYQWTKDGRYAGTYPYVYSEKRAAEFYYSEPINWVPVKMFVAADSDYQQINDLKKKNLCLPYGYTLDSWSKQFFEQFEFRINRAKDAKACAGQVMKHWSDVGLINGYFSSTELMERFGSLDNMRLLKEKIGKVPLHFIVPKSMANAQDFINRFNQSLQAIHDKGETQQINQNFVSWLGHGNEPTEATQNDGVTTRPPKKKQVIAN